MRALASAGVLAVLFGCLPSTSSPSGATDSATGSDDPTELGNRAVAGEVIDLSGAPVVDVVVTVSDEVCVPDRSSASGSFTIEKVKDGPQRVIVYGETAPAGPFASVVMPIDVAGDTTLPDPIRVPHLDERHPIDPLAQAQQVINSGDGLRLVIEPGTLTLAPFFAPEILVARVPVAMAPPFIPDGVELLDLHVLHPIRSRFEPPAAIEFPPNPELAPGTAVIFHGLDYDTGLLTPVASGTVNADGVPVTDPGQGIPELTWIGVSLK
jgi:hypothetical protein